MKLALGANYLSVSSLGRACLAGNSGTHTVKFVNASTGMDVPGGSVPVNMSGCVPGQFVYSALISPITLQANTAYYLATQELIGGDQWYDYSGILTANDAAVSSSIYSVDGSNWIPASVANTSYVPPNFQYSTAPPPPDLTITLMHAGNFTQGDTGDVYTITVRNSGGTATTGTVSVSDAVPSGLTGTAISGVGWNCTQPAGPCTRSDALNGGGTYPAINFTVNVAANAPASVTDTATVSGGGEINTSNDTASDSANIAGGSVAVTMQSNPAGQLFTVDGTTYTTTQIFSWVAGSPHTIAAANMQAGAVGTQYIWSAWSDGGAISHTVSPTTSTTFTANFSTQYFLTTAASPVAGGSINPPSGWYTSGASVSVSAAANSGYQFTGFTGGAVSGTTTPQSVTINGPVTVTAAFAAATAVTVTTAPAGLSLTVDGGSCIAPCQFQWTPGSNHTLAVGSTQAGSAGIQYVFGNWSDTGAQSHTITVPASAATYTANFTTQYFLTTAASPALGGTINPSSGWFTSGAVVSVSVAANSGYGFAGFTGPLSGITTPQNVTISGPATVTASFVALVPVTVTAAPAGLSLTVDTGSCTAPCQFQWTPGSNHTVAVTATPQAGTAGTRYVFANWSDNGTQSHSITVPGSATAYTANFTTQYLLTAGVTPSGAGSIAINPVSATGYYNSGTAVQLAPAPSSGYVFLNWGGDLSGSAGSQTVTMSNAHTVTANFQAVIPGITGYASTGQSVRNDFSGWVGMKFTVGGNSLLAATLGRICVPGNSGTHTIKFVNAITGIDVSGGSILLSMSGCAAGQFVYGALTNPIALLANTSYYLVSQEATGGDQWYDYGTISPGPDAAVNSSVYFNGTAWIGVGSANTSYVPPNFQYSVGVPDNALVTGYFQNSERNDFNGWVGMEFTVGASGMTVSSLGRLFLPGNSGTHTVKLVRASDGTDVPGGSVPVSMAGASAGLFSYAPLASSITLLPNTAYYLVSQEILGGDQWYDYGPVSTTSAGTVNNAVYSMNGAWMLAGGANMSYVPPNLK